MLEKKIRSVCVKRKLEKKREEKVTKEREREREREREIFSEKK